MDLQRTSKHWDSHHFSDDFLRAEWSFHPEAKARLHRQLGAPSREVWFHNTYLAGRSGLRALGVGVGRAVTEVNVLSLGAIGHYDLYDLSPAALADGEAYAESRGLADKADFICADFQLADIPDGSYDVITFIASLHHIEQLDVTLAKCRRALAPGGVLWAAEYIGPDYFEYPPEHTLLARKVFHLLDPAEEAFPFGAPTVFEDGESGLRMPLRPDEVKERYQRMFAAHRADLEGRFAASGVEYVPLRTDQPLDHALYAFLDHRLARGALCGTGSRHASRGCTGRYTSAGDRAGHRGR